MPVIATFTTSKGMFKARLMPEHAPKTVANFVELASGKREWRDPRDGKKKNAPLYDGTVFHRVMPGFMIQGGGHLPGLEEKETREAIQNESFNGLSNEAGTIAMARTNDPNSASAQFFINVANNNAPERINLDRTKDKAGYCVFGRVLEGMDVADKIAAVRTHYVTVARQTAQGVQSAPFENVPVEDVVIKSIRRVEK